MRILLVEDHDDTRTVLSRLLARLGYHVTPASGVKAALLLLDCFAFDALVSDIGLPDGDGFALVAEAKKRMRFRTTIAVTVLGSDADRERGYKAGFDHYLTKPLNLAKLRS